MRFPGARRVVAGCRADLDAGTFAGRRRRGHLHGGPLRDSRPRGLPRSDAARAAQDARQVPAPRAGRRGRFRDCLACARPSVEPDRRPQDPACPPDRDAPTRSRGSTARPGRLPSSDILASSRVHEVADLDGLPILVCDFVTGTSLRDLLATHRLGHRAAVKLVAKVADALAYAHSMGAIHRDIKPANIMLDTEPRRLGCGHDDGRLGSGRVNQGSSISAWRSSTRSRSI